MCTRPMVPPALGTSSGSEEALQLSFQQRWRFPWPYYLALFHKFINLGPLDDQVIVPAFEHRFGDHHFGLSSYNYDAWNRLSDFLRRIVFVPVRIEAH